MAQKDAFDELRKAKEEEYFHKKENELLEKLRQRATADVEQKKLSEELRTSDPQILADLLELGYQADTVRLLFVIPLVYVAWADGSITARERSLILELAKVEGPAKRQLTQWLDEKPTREFFERSLRIIGSLIPAGEKGDLLSRCLRIAQESGGILGLASISMEERAAMKEVAAEIERNHSEASRQMLERL